MSDESKIERILREEMARSGIETAALPSGTISVRRIQDRHYEVIADFGSDVPWKRFDVDATDGSDWQVRAAILDAFGVAEYDALRILEREDGSHVWAPGECWCGHGQKDFEMEGFADTDGAHSLVGIDHQPECQPDCNAFHFHFHCRECAVEGEKKFCCI